MELKKQSKGEEVMKLQKLLYLKEDGIYGPQTEQAVKDFQTIVGLKPTGVADEAVFFKLRTTPVKKSRRPISEIIIHCSATEHDKDFKNEDIKKWHLAKGYADIGYHYVVYLNGTIHNGRNVNLIGAHCVNHNSRSIGICYIGGLLNGKPYDTRTDKQKESLTALIRTLKRMYPEAKVYGHNEFANKSCPCFNVAEYNDI